MTLYLKVLTILLIAESHHAYNLDIQNIEIFDDPVGNSHGKNNRASYFGYSVALYVNGKEKLLLVGAPRANSSRINDREQGIVEAGAVYTCSILHTKNNYTNRNLCNEWEIESSIFGPQNKKKDHAWLGGTIAIENSTTPKVAVCAPRWTKVVDIHYWEQWYMNGMCYTITANESNPLRQLKSNSVKKYFPLSNPDDQTIIRDGGKSNFYYHGMGQAGFSIDLNPETHDLVLGAPGFFHWTGSSVLINGKDQQYSLRSLRPNIVDDQRFEYNSYIGYSMTSGHFYKPTERLYASGAPRSAETLGEVFIFSFPQFSKEKMIIRRILKGEQYGEYFGSSLASCDINNDGRDDLLVGAPHWSHVIEEGRIFVFVSKEKSEFEVQRIHGETERGRFGTVISCLGDLDLDGRGDVAVGAPYEDEGRGVVYIYNGASNGLVQKFSQRIRATDSSSLLRGFGASISQPRDLDGNGYPDIAIGAYLSGHAVVLKSRPVIVLNVELTQAENFTLMENSTYFIVDVCKEYDGNFVPKTLKTALALTIDGFHKRAIVYQNGRLFGNIYKASSILTRGERKCSPVKINLKKNIQNVVDPIEIVANVSLIEDTPCINCPVINPILSKTSDSLKLAYILDCGTDEICISDLFVNVTSNSGSNYTIGSKSNVNLTIFIDNVKEPAYKAQVHIYLPSPIFLGRIPPECDEQIEVNGTFEVICNIGNPLRHNRTITVELDMSLIHYTDNFKEIKVAVTTQSNEDNIMDNAALFKINCTIDADVSLSGKADGDLYSFLENEIDHNKSKVLAFDHVYEIWEFGDTPIDEATFILELPTHWKDIEIANINHIWNSNDKQQYDCEQISDNESNPTVMSFNYTDFIFEEKKQSQIITPGERTVYANCSNEDTTCQKFICKLGPFVKVQSIVTLTVAIDFDLSNITSKEMAKKDVILFVTQGFIMITKPNFTVNSVNGKTHFKQITTTFLLHHEPEEVAMWIIILSVILGMLLLLFITSLLFKLGFFNRQIKEDLDALKSTEPMDAFG